MAWSVIKQDGKTYEPTYKFQQFSKEEWERYPFASESDLKWHKEARVGLFLHYGVSSVGKVDIGWPRYTHILPDMKHGCIPDEVYDNWHKELTMENFNAEKWVQFAKDNGFKYIVVITKHHDGFHAWDTAYSDYNITKTPFKRDYIKELSDACHKIDMKIGFYFSQRDWYHPDYQPVDPTKAVATEHPPFYKCIDENKDILSLEITQKHKNFIKYMHNVVLELMSNYGKIDIF